MWGSRWSSRRWLELARRAMLSPRSLDPTKFIKHLVSKQKRRLVVDGFDLDLTYITDQAHSACSASSQAAQTGCTAAATLLVRAQVIAMGLPSSGLTAMYRNPMTEVCDFLNKYHDGQYKVYNLCTRPQDQYDPSKFGGNVASFPFADHGVPPLAVVDELAHSVQNWVTSAPERIVCIHCLAGKGRTGLMVCAALLLLGSFSSAGDAMAFYGERRMKNKKGVTQASQRRWVEYYQQSLTGRVDMKLQRTLVQVRVEGYPASKHLSLQVITPGGKQLLDTGPFGGQASVCLGLTEDFCFQLSDEDGKPMGALWLHAAL